MAVKPNVGFIPLGDYYQPLANVKMILDMLTGRAGGEIKPLPATATNAQIIAAVNQIIARLNAGTN
jgi:hypothetical protein